ncbi:MAG: hypothetical protein K0R57_2532 [Paenibacillaceae bacterium]|jgi:uncharacterized protein (DUF2249 family)|nr:hypothetical protein [Paenibacillaceae bacterium]
MSPIITTVHAPEYPSRIRHQVIMEAFDQLAPGTAMLLVNDHEPRPLYYQFQAERTGIFTWEYVEEGPEWFQVKITKLQDTNN